MCLINIGPNLTLQGTIIDFLFDYANTTMYEINGFWIQTSKWEY